MSIARTDGFVFPTLASIWRKSRLSSAILITGAALISLGRPKLSGLRTNGSSAHSPRMLRVVATATVLAIAAFLRLSQLSLKPLHHDEAVNGFFLLGLFREGIYRYNAANYHGPTLYYFALISSSMNNLLFNVEGPTTSAIRLVPALFGLGIVGLVFGFRDRLGQVGVLFAAGLLAFSPGMVYLSRDFIHETLLGFFTLWLVACGVQFYDTRRPRPLLLGSIAAALMFSTKETAPISLAAIAIAALLTVLLVPSPTKLSASEFGGWQRIVLLLSGSVALFAACTFLFFSSFLSDTSEGIRAAVRTYSYWFRTGMSQHRAPWYAYLNWLLREEPVILFSATCGTALALFHRRNRFALFAGLWSFTLLFAYSLLPYKTPWILENALLPMSLAAGYAAEQLWNATFPVSGKMWRRVVPVSVIAGTLLFALYQSAQLNFYHYDDDHYVYPYVQTQRGFLDLVQQVERFADLNGAGNNTSVAIMAPEYWPLPWYLRNYKNTAYFGKPLATNASMVIASVRQLPELRLLLADHYRLIGTYPMRPGVQLVLYAANGTGK
jgi:uncharacterized protein (TIGR03663 family)